MKKLLLVIIVGALNIPLCLKADDVIPSVAKEQMGEYKNAFGKAIADSKKAEDVAQDESKKDKPDPKGIKPDNFGNKVSDAAKNMKADILKDNKNFGAWVSKQRSQKPDDAGSAKGASASAKASTAGGRPSTAGQPDSSAGKPDSAGKPSSPGQSGSHPR